MIPRSPLVGRETERSLLGGLLEEASEGRGSMALIGGEPGVGKTRLAEEVSADARQAGFRTLVGRCRDMEGGVPYLPFVEIIEELARVLPPDQLRNALGDGATEVARIVPELRGRFAAVPAATLPSAEGRRPLFNAVSDLFSRLALEPGLLLVLDDLHWADESTLMLLEHLAPRLERARIVVLATYRDTELGLSRPLARTVQELLRQRLAKDILLRRLSEEDVAGMLRSRRPGEPPARLVSLIYRETEGNPFFVEEVARYLAETGRLLDPNGAWLTDATVGETDVPRSVRLVIEQRLERVSGDCRRMLAEAAVVGREFGFAVLEAMGSLAPGALLDAVEEAERAALVRDVSRGTEARYAFTHELVRQAFLAGISLPRRQRLHARIAGAMEQVYAPDLDAHCAEIAHHLEQAGPAADPEKAFEYSARAGGVSARAMGWREAASHYENALQALGRVKAADTVPRRAALLGLAEALAWAGDSSGRVYEIAAEVYELAMAAGAVAQASRAAILAIASMQIEHAGLAAVRPEYREWATRLDGLAPEESGDRIYADLAMARIAGAASRLDETEERCLRALDLARKIGAADTVILEILRTLASHCLGPKFGDRRRQVAAEVASRLAVLPRGITLLAANHDLGMIVAGEALEVGDRSEAERVVDLMFEFERQRPTEATGGTAGYYRDILFRHMDGDLEPAFEAAERVRARMNFGEPWAFLVMGWNFGIRARYYLGRAPDDMPRIMASEEYVFQPPRALLFAAFAREAQSRAILVRTREAVSPPMAAAPDTWATPALVSFLEAATLLGDRDLVQWFAGPIWECGAVTTGWMYTTVVKRHLGAAAALLGQPARARDYYERALAEAIAMRFRPEIALTRVDLAQLLFQEFPADRSEALEHLAIAIPELEAMKMAPALARALALQERLGEPGPAPLPCGLSPREAEVLRLVAAGKSNAEIAEALVLSVRTVERHITNAYDKIGAHGRVDATAYVLRTNL